MTETITLPRTSRRVKEEEEQDVKKQPPYNVILLNDDDHTYEYVIGMLQQLFGYPKEKGFLMAKEVDSTDRVIVLTTTNEHPELKREQIHAFAADPLLSRSTGSMAA